MAKNQMAQLIAENQRLKGYIARIESERPAQLLFSIQQTVDFFMVALGRVRHYGPKRQRENFLEFKKVSKEFHALTNQDYIDDQVLWYMKDRLDRELKEYCGKHFESYDERYEATMKTCIPSAVDDDVVHCAECIKCGVDEEKGLFCKRQTSPSMWVHGNNTLRPDDYCSYGERRD